MGRVANELADRVIVTNDNPRSRGSARDRRGDPAGLRDDVEVDPDRRSAIASAIAARGPGDVVVIAGKGHEQGQEIGGVVAPVRRPRGACGLRGWSGA